MGREIKFRAWTDQGTRGNFRMMRNVGILPLHSPAEWKENPDGLFLKPESRHIIMQYTGLKDKNGKEIYEGDIVKILVGTSFTTIVEWDNSGFTTKDNEGRNCWYNQEFIEIIGNIYENKNLLK